MTETVDIHAPGVEVKKSCCYFCHQNCGVLAYVKGGEVIKIEGDPDHPTNQGGLCCRGNIALKHLNHPARVNHALKRAGNKGDNKWVEVPYDQAISEIAERLNQIKEESGAEAVATAGGTLRTDDWARRRFMNIFGSPNGFHNALLCWIPTFMVETAVSGWSPFETELGNSRCLILWGCNPGASNMPGMRGYNDLRKKGLKIIVVDPRYSESAAHADLWLPLRPGSDTALALAMVNTVIFEGLYDKDFVANWTVGFDELKKHIKPYTARWAGELTWLDPELIREAARMYAKNTPGNIQWGCTADQLGRSAGAGMHARAILRAICGNLDCPGGDLMPGPAQNYITDEEMEANDWLPEEQKAKQIGSDKFKLTSWPGYQMIADTAKATWGKAPTAEWMCEAHGPSVFKAIITGDPYRVRALIVNATNPINCYGDSKMTLEALKRVEFLVTVDYWITPSALWSDYVLPAASALERPIMHNNYGVTDSLICSQRAIEPMYDRHTDYTFWRALAMACGQPEEMWPWEREEDAFFYIVQPTGYPCNSYDEFVENYRFYYPPQVFNKHLTRGSFCTPSGKVELKSSILEKLGYPALPTYIGPIESEEDTPELVEEYPLVLTTGGGFMPFHHSEQFNITSVRFISSDPYFTINPEKAAEMGIEQGDWCWIETRRGRIKQRANVEPSVDPRVIYAQRGWWYPERGPAGPDPFGCLESNVNVLTSVDDWDCDPIGGSWANRGLLCKVYKVEPGDAVDTTWSIPGSASEPGVTVRPSEQNLAYELVPYEPKPDFEVPEGLTWDPDSGYAWDLENSLYYDPESGWLVSPETGAYYDLVTKYAYDSESGWLVDADGVYYDLETRYAYDPESGWLVSPEGVYYDLETKYAYDPESGWLVDGNGVYYDLETKYAYCPDCGNLVDANGLQYDIETKALIEGAAPSYIPEGLTWDADSGYAWDLERGLYYDPESGWLIHPETGVYYDVETRYAYDAESGWLIADDGVYYDLETRYAYDPNSDTLVDMATGAHYNRETKERVYGAGEVPAPPGYEKAAEPGFEVPEGLTWDPEGGYAWDLERGLYYDPESGWLVHPETGVYYDVETRYAYDESGMLVDEEGNHYDLETKERVYGLAGVPEAPDASDLLAKAQAGWTGDVGEAGEGGRRLVPAGPVIETDYNHGVIVCESSDWKSIDYTGRGAEHKPEARFLNPAFASKRRASKAAGDQAAPAAPTGPVIETDYNHGVITGANSDWKELDYASGTAEHKPEFTSYGDANPVEPEKNNGVITGANSNWKELDYAGATAEHRPEDRFVGAAATAAAAAAAAGGAGSGATADDAYEYAEEGVEDFVEIGPIIVTDYNHGVITGANSNWKELDYSAPTAAHKPDEAFLTAVFPKVVHDEEPEEGAAGAEASEAAFAAPAGPVIETDYNHGVITGANSDWKQLDYASGTAEHKPQFTSYGDANPVEPEKNNGVITGANSDWKQLDYASATAEHRPEDRFVGAAATAAAAAAAAGAGAASADDAQAGSTRTIAPCVTYDAERNEIIVEPEINHGVITGESVDWKEIDYSKRVAAAPADLSSMPQAAREGEVDNTGPIGTEVVDWKEIDYSKRKGGE